MSPTIAIVGAGPAGFYAADGLLRKAPGVTVDIIDRLPTPHGLVRAGVAPDHQGTKAVSRVFERVLDKPGVRFLGNVALGRDLALDELRTLYDAVILATGAPTDRRLGIPGEDLPGVHGSGAFVGWYNGHPDHAGHAPDLDVEAAAVIGNGNVAIDVVRVLARTPAELAASDIADDARARIAASPLRRLHMIGRRGPVEASFTNSELAELGRLEGASPRVDRADLPAGIGAVAEPERRVKEANLATLREFAGRTASPAGKVIDFRFHASPVAILGTDRVTGLRLAAGSGTVDLACGLVVTCIGYSAPPLDGVIPDAAGIYANDGGRIADNLYVVGWARRGPSGTIPTNRADSQAVVERLLATIDAGRGASGPDGLDGLLAGRGVEIVGRDGWRAIDRAETAGAPEGAPRRKLTDPRAMLAAAREAGDRAP
ncbi:FAD-dependent oxidoreductase [Oceanibacterium hippocampi]|uniref:NADPH-ferredoxin reductase FprA n=1 Tax=Oceanibacterium hippocampi TaxID=745714 RepID=A0A1Y5SVV1_9PROT|nr:FAD-dependent oxidoreductase [Oceanibacterium hippocampi]SLN49569.1 NADPH-ferredoxin reductase FprA [Oceanibacterium hippocampi]